MKRHTIQMFGILILFILSFSLAESSYIPENQSFRPVYSQKLTGYVTPDQPMKIITDIRDSETGFFRIFAWGPDENTSDFNLWTDQGNEVVTGYTDFNSTINKYPEVITVRNLSSEYLMVEPGIYSTVLNSINGSGSAEVYIQYIYHENIDMGSIADKGYSVWEIDIPPGLARVLFLTESLLGSDLDLFIQKGENLSDSFESFDYSSISDCTDCWDTGIDNWISEKLVLEDPEPGKYLMVTYAHDGEDYFMSYWMGVESYIQNQSQEKNNTTGEDRMMKEKVRTKYSKIPFNLQFSHEKEENITSARDVVKAFQPHSHDPNSKKSG